MEIVPEAHTRCEAVELAGWLAQQADRQTGWAAVSSQKIVGRGSSPVRPRARETLSGLSMLADR